MSIQGRCFGEKSVANAAKLFFQTIIEYAIPESLAIIVLGQPETVIEFLLILGKYSTNQPYHKRSFLVQ